jgi:hypothetical protein
MLYSRLLSQALTPSSDSSPLSDEHYEFLLYGEYTQIGTADRYQSP